MFDTICTLPLSSDAFAQAIHPTEPVISVGLASGHVQTFRLPPAASNGSESDEDAPPASENGVGCIDTAWRTRRHKGSCRTLDFSHDGASLYSAGTDGIVKCADAETGQVAAKLVVPLHSKRGDIDAPTLLHALSPQTLILATDAGALHTFDLRARGFPSQAPQQTHRPHDDYVSSLTALPASAASASGFRRKWITTGGTTLAVTDLRRGVLSRSEDQEEELLSSVFVGGLSRRGTNVGEKVAVGGATGVLTLWEHTVWDDQDERIVIDRGVGGGESLDALTLVPDGVGPGGKVVAVGVGDGTVRFARIGPNRVIGEVRHDETEGVVALGFDVGGRMISAGGQVLKVWHEKVEEEEEEEEEQPVNGVGSKRQADSDAEEDGNDDDDESSSSSDDERSKRRKRRKRGSRRAQAKPQSLMEFSGLD